MPAWLRELGATLSSEDRLEPDAPEEASEIPAWLRDLQSSMPAEIVAGMEPVEEKDEDTEAEYGSPLSPQEVETPPSTARTEERTDWLAEPTELAAPGPQGDQEQPDWLAEVRSPAGDRAPVETPDAPEPESEAAPDWLGATQPSDMEEAAQPELPAFDPVDEDSLDWLAELIPPPSESDIKPARPEPRADEEQVSDWLSELGVSTEEPKALPEKPPIEAEAVDTSDWWAEFDSSDTEASLDREAADSELDQVPDWLAALQASTAEPAPPSEPPSIPQEPEPEVARNLPKWEDQEEEGLEWTPEPQPPVAVPEPEHAEPPVEPEPEDKVDRIPPFPSSAIEGEEESGLAGTVPDEVELAEWLAGLRPPSAEPEPEPVSPAMADDADEFGDQLGELPRGEEPDLAPSTWEEEVPGAAVPAWLAELQVESAEEPAADLEEALAKMDATDWLVPSEARIDEGELEMAEIPAWLLALKPPELREEGEPAQPLPIGKEIDQDTGLLSGLKGTLPVEMIIAQPRAVTAAQVAAVSVAETPHSRLFGEILGRAQEAAPRSIVDVPTETPSMLPRWLLYILLIAVVSLPLLLGEPLVLRTIEPAPATADLYSGIESLDAEANVLIAFDYDPTTSGEMDVIAQALVGHLMDRGVRIIAMSLLPAGPATAQPLLENLASERTGYDDGYGQSYVNLGYLPGQAMAVRLLGASPNKAFARDFQGTLLADLPIMQGLASAQDFDLVLELAAGQESVRWWIEQASTPYELPLGAGVSAPVAPLIQPYYETDPRQLVGLIGGVPGAVTYEALQSGQGIPDQSTVARLDSQMLGQLLLVLVLLLGNGIFLVQRGGRR